MPQSSDSEDKRVDSAAGRLLRRLAADESFNLGELASFARIPLEDLHACRHGEARLPPEQQMHLAAAVMTISPKFERIARALYAQAQSELRLLAGEVATHGSYPGSGTARALLSNTPPRGVAAQDAWLEGKAAIEHARELNDASEKLRNEAQRLVAQGHTLSAEHIETMRRDVEGLARALRESGAPPERALVVMTKAIAPLVAADPAEGEGMLRHIVCWFVESYYAH